MGGNSGAFYDESLADVKTISAMGSVVQPGDNQNRCRITVPKVIDWEVLNILSTTKSEDGMDVDEAEDSEMSPPEILIGSEGISQLDWLVVTHCVCAQRPGMCLASLIM